jgi:hypothetical protein
MTGTDDFLARLEDYLDNAEGTTALPSTVRDAIRAELPSTRQVGPLWGPLRFFSMATQLPRSSRYALVAVIAIALIGGGSLVVGSMLPGPSPTPTPSAAPQASDPAGIFDGLVSAWNAGDGQQAASLYVTAPLVRFWIDSGAVTDTYSTGADVQAAINQWHSQGSTLARTGDVLTQGPYSAATVSWTTSQGSYNGAEVIHITPEGLVTAEYLIGASSSQATGTAAGTDVVQALTQAMTTPVKPIVLRLGAADLASYAPNVQIWQFENDDSGGLIAQSPSDIAGVLGAPHAADSFVFAIQTQGPFVLYSASAADEGFNVLELTSGGLIQYSWDIRIPLNQVPAPGS